MYEELVLPNGIKVQFYPDTHTYIVDGKELPSITTLLKKVYGDTYAAVNPEVLQRAAEYGTAVHTELQQMIEMRQKNPGIPLFSSYQEVTNYFTFVEPIYHIEPIMTEKVVVLYDQDGQPCAAGRFDLLCNVNGEKTLADFKTTSTIHRQLVTAQLNLYLIAARQSGYLSEDEEIKLGAIHLSGEKSKFVPIVNLNKNFYLQFIK